MGALGPGAPVHLRLALVDRAGVVVVTIRVGGRAAAVRPKLVDVEATLVSDTTADLAAVRRDAVGVKAANAGGLLVLTLLSRDVAAVDRAGQAVVALELALNPGLRAALWVGLDVGALTLRAAEIAFVDGASVVVVALDVGGAGGALAVDARVVASLPLTAIVGVVTAIFYRLIVAVATDTERDGALVTVFTLIREAAAVAELDVNDLLRVGDRSAVLVDQVTRNGVHTDLLQVSDRVGRRVLFVKGRQRLNTVEIATDLSVRRAQREV